MGLSGPNESASSRSGPPTFRRRPGPAPTPAGAGGGRGRPRGVGGSSAGPGTHPTKLSRGPRLESVWCGVTCGKFENVREFNPDLGLSFMILGHMC